MSGNPSRDKYLPYALPCQSIAYRMIPKDARWIAPDGTPDPAMFYRKSNERDGVSLSTTIKAGLERMARVKREVEGIRSLHVGWVRNIKPVNKLDVRSKDGEDTHAAITGLPYEDEDLGEAEKFAGELLKISRPEDLPSSK